MNQSENSLSHFFAFSNISKEKFAEIAKTKEFKALKEKLSKELPGVPVTEAFMEMIVKQLSDLLNIDVRAILLSTWNKSGEILQYADSQKYTPEETFMVPLSKHTITSEHAPVLQLFINKKQVGEIQLDIKLHFTVKGVLLKIQNSRIMAVNFGSCQGKGTVKYGKLSLLERKTKSFTLPGSIELGSGIPLNDAIANVHHTIDTIAKA